MTPPDIMEAEPVVAPMESEGVSPRVEVRNSLPKLAVPRLRRKAAAEDGTGSLFERAGVVVGGSVAVKPESRPVTVGRVGLKKSSTREAEQEARRRQRDLALQSVKPVRNDLADADLEVVERTPDAGAQAGAEAPDGGPAQKLAHRWMAKLAQMAGRQA